ncbi:MAG: SusC/RagA family TonB-linked outer membrane protein, partial [Bacteroidales bacterium]|nr:SusC/RagA family TonB-linked outer membrane protein [Bacteroidales bacterium]MBQ8812574.1 SusC/RagA family TonB-linked outer membrane protein [Bacteroidales bacterium]
GASTGLDGDYVLTVSSADAVVEISCIGYASQTFVASQVPATVTLSEDTQFLDEVVVIGYGTVKKEDMTGSITAIKTEEINRGAVVNTQDMLKGKVAGLNVIPGDGGPGSKSKIRIRGAASLKAENEPLYIIDGVPITSSAGSGMSNPLDLINPNDIESFSILKDASSAAIYGSRASNGVIIITTKKGKGSGAKVSYNGSVSVQNNSTSVPVMSASEFKNFMTERFQDNPTYWAIVEPMLGDAQINYEDLIFQTAFTHDHNVSVTGNVKDRLPYRASIGYMDQSGTIKGSTYDKGTLDISLSPNFLDKHLTVNLNAKGVYAYSNYKSGGVVGNGAFFNPTIDPYWRNEDGSVNTNITNGYWNYGSFKEGSFIPNRLIGSSPLSVLNDDYSNAGSTRFIGNAAVDYKVHGFEALRFNVSVGTDRTWTNSASGVNIGSFQAECDTENPGKGQYSKSKSVSFNDVLEAYANFNDTWGVHNLDLMAGYSWQHIYNGGQSITYFNGSDEVKLDEGDTIDSRYPYGASEYYMVSFYGRANYSIASKYLFTASIRTDGVSKFSPATRWGIFPSGAFAWNIKEEGFLKDVKPVSQLKLRLSAGVTGQQEGIGEYSHLAMYYLSNNPYGQYNMGDLGFSEKYTPGAYDPNIKWETSTTYNVGVDFGFINDRITGSVDAYMKNTNDLLYTVTTPMGANFSNTVMTNIGSMQNKGVEFAFNFIPVQTNDWSVQFGVNGTFSETIFTKLRGGESEEDFEPVTDLSFGTGTKLSRHQVGYAPFSYYVYQQLYDADGMPIQNAFVDRSGDGVITEADKYFAGDPNPDFYYGLNFKASYRNWDFGFNGHGNIGYKVYNAFKAGNSTSHFDINAGNLSNYATVVKTTGFTQPNDLAQYVSDYFIEDASFFRMDDINLGYTFKEIGNWAGSIRVAASCQNVFVITGFSGIDPELDNNTGVSNTFWPRPRTYSLRLNVNF